MFLRLNLVSLKLNLVFLRLKTSVYETKSSVSKTKSTVSGTPRDTRFGLGDVDSGSSSGFRLWGGPESMFLRQNLVF